MILATIWKATAVNYEHRNAKDFLQYNTEEEVIKALRDSIEAPICPYIDENLDIEIDDTEYDIDEEHLQIFLEDWKKLKENDTNNH
jgi:hypothetical protein